LTRRSSPCAGRRPSTTSPEGERCGGLQRLGGSPRGGPLPAIPSFTSFLLSHPPSPCLSVGCRRQGAPP
jgi:hypothetical protein